MKDNQSHALVDEAYEVIEEKLQQDEVTSDDVVEVGELFREAMDHPEQDIWTTLNAEGPKNQCIHHKHPDGPYEYPPHESPRECLLGILNHEVEVKVS